MSISLKIHELKENFEKAQDWEERYRQLMELGRKLSPMDEALKIEKFRIKGCQSQVWLAPRLEDKKVYFSADSDALLVKGIIALLVHVYSGEKASDILNHSDDFLSDMGITEHLSMNRSNGLASMMKQIKMYAFAYNAMEG